MNPFQQWHNSLQPVNKTISRVETNQKEAAKEDEKEDDEDEK